MITFQEARERASKALGAAILLQGHETDSLWIVEVYHAKPVFDDLVTVVDKQTGAVSQETYFDLQEKLQGMRKVTA